MFTSNRSLPSVHVIHSYFNYFYVPNSSFLQLVVHQFYQTRVIDEFVLRGNSATLKCLVPSFVADFIDVEAWLDEEGVEITRPLPDESTGKAVELSLSCSLVYRDNSESRKLLTLHNFSSLLITIPLKFPYSSNSVCNSSG